MTTAYETSKKLHIDYKTTCAEIYDFLGTVPTDAKISFDMGYIGYGMNESKGVVSITATWRS